MHQSFHETVPPLELPLKTDALAACCGPLPCFPALSSAHKFNTRVDFARRSRDPLQPHTSPQWLSQSVPGNVARSMLASLVGRPKSDAMAGSRVQGAIGTMQSANTTRMRLTVIQALSAWRSLKLTSCICKTKSTRLDINWSLKDMVHKPDLPPPAMQYNSEV